MRTHWRVFVAPLLLGAAIVALGKPHDARYVEHAKAAAKPVRVQQAPYVKAQDINDRELQEYAAYLINLNGYLCGKVISLRLTERDGVFLVTCHGKSGIEGTNHYMLDGNTNNVTKI